MNGRRLTLRAACWLHYWDAEQPDAAAAVMATSLTFRETVDIETFILGDRPASGMTGLIDSSMTR